MALQKLVVDALTHRIRIGKQLIGQSFGDDDRGRWLEVGVADPVHDFIRIEVAAGDQLQSQSCDGMFVAEIQGSPCRGGLLIRVQVDALARAAVGQGNSIRGKRILDARQGSQRRQVALLTRSRIRRTAHPLIVKHHDIGFVDAGWPLTQDNPLLDDEQGIAQNCQRNRHLHGDQNGADLVTAHG